MIVFEFRLVSFEVMLLLDDVGRYGGTTAERNVRKAVTDLEK